MPSNLSRYNAIHYTEILNLFASSSFMKANSRLLVIISDQRVYHFIKELPLRFLTHTCGMTLKKGNKSNFPLVPTISLGVICCLPSDIPWV